MREREKKKAFRDEICLCNAKNIRWLEKKREPVRKNGGKELTMVAIRIMPFFPFLLNYGNGSRRISEVRLLWKYKTIFFLTQPIVYVCTKTLHYSPVLGYGVGGDSLYYARTFGKFNILLVLEVAGVRVPKWATSTVLYTFLEKRVYEFQNASQNNQWELKVKWSPIRMSHIIICLLNLNQSSKLQFHTL